MPCRCGTEGRCIWEPLGRKLKGWCDSAEQQRQTTWPKYSDLFEDAVLMTEKTSEQRHLLTVSLSCNALIFSSVQLGTWRRRGTRKILCLCFRTMGHLLHTPQCKIQCVAPPSQLSWPSSAKHCPQRATKEVSFLKNNGLQVGQGLWKRKGGWIYLCKTCSTGYYFWSFLPEFSLAPAFGPIRWAVR